VSLGSATPHVASYLIVKRDGKIAFVWRTGTKWMNDHYGLPSGKVETNESYTQAAIREAKEEIGIDIQPEHLKYLLTMHRYEPSSHAAEWVDVYFEVLEWQGEPYNAEPHKHGELAWLDPNNLPEKIIPTVRFALEEIQAGKVYTEYGWN
jgi:8-oxo-dGTP pyrophosphatase MutT (NUDIX family)